MQPPARGHGGAGDDDPIVARIRAWSSRPTAETSLALFADLRRQPGLRGQHADLLTRAFQQRVSSETGGGERWASDPRVLVGLGRVQLQVGKLGDAQQTLVAAGRADPNAREPYRYLGEVLLRRGDAARAERMLEKAVEIERREPVAGDESAQEWLQRARGLKSLQDAQGEGAVAAEVASQLAARRASVPPPSRSLRPPAAAQPDARQGPYDDEPTHVGTVPENLRRLAMPGREPADPSAYQAEPDDEDNAATNEIPAVRPPSAAPNVAAPPVRRPPPAPRAAPANIALTPGVLADDSGRVPAQPAELFGSDQPTVRMADDAESVPRLRATPPRTDDPSPLPGPLPTKTGALRALKAQSVTLGEPRRDERLDTVRARPSVMPREAPAEPRREAWEPDRVLDALARAGVYEPEAAAVSPAQWAKNREVRHVRRRGGWIFLVLGFLVFGGVAGGIFGVRAYKVQSQRAAESAVGRAESAVRKASLPALAAAEKDLAEAFELDSRTLVGARVWLQDRVLRSYLWPSDNRKEGGLASALERAKSVGLPEPELAFARIALALSGDDTPSAAALAKTLDPGSAKEKVDAWRELTVGWVLERAGDARAVDRYAHAVRLDPDLVPARLSLAKLAAMSGDLARVDAETAGLPDELSATRQDLRALARLVASAPPEKPGLGDAPRPAGFGWIAPALVLADAGRSPEDRKRAGAQAVGLARDPGDLTRIGRLAAATGDEPTATRAALRALEASPIFPPARALGARLALSAGRSDDAARALDGVSSDGDAELGALRAWVAYERQDLVGVAAALDDPKVPAAAWESPENAPIVKPLRQALIFAKRSFTAKDRPALEELAGLGELGSWVAFDVAFGASDVATAESIAKAWGDEAAPRPARALRRARLARARGKADEADKLSRLAFEQSTVTPSALVERVLVLGALGKGADALALLGRYPLLAADEQPWLRAWATAQSGKIAEAKKQLAALAEPDKKAPWLVRRDALLAFAATNDKRAKALAKELVKERPGDPDVHAVAKALGLAKG